MRKSMLLVGSLFAVLILLSFSTMNVSAPTGTSVVISTVDGYMSGTDTKATFTVTVTNNEASGSHHVFLTLKDIALPAGSQWASGADPGDFPDLHTGMTYSFSPSELDVGAGQSKQSTLTITGMVGTPPGYKTFKAAGYWIAYVLDDPIRNVYASSWVTGSVIVIVKLIIPEYLLGTLLGLVGMFAAFGAYYFQKRKQFSP